MPIKKYKNADRAEFLLIQASKQRLMFIFRSLIEELRHRRKWPLGFIKKNSTVDLTQFNCESKHEDCINLHNRSMLTLQNV